MRVEFSLHCMAYNLLRAKRIEESAEAAFLGVFSAEWDKNVGCRFQIAVLSPISVFVVKWKVEDVTC